MKNKAAKQSAMSVYGDIFTSTTINSKKYHWAFDRLRNAETGFDRNFGFLRYKELDVVSIKPTPP